jgi:hypothetical protein
MAAFVVALFVCLACAYELARLSLQRRPRLYDPFRDAGRKHRTFRLQVTDDLPESRGTTLVVDVNWAHWFPEGTHHGRQSLPRFVAVRLYPLAVQRPSSSWRVWLYVRGGYALHADVTFDRRPE